MEHNHSSTILRTSGVIATIAVLSLASACSQDSENANESSAGNESPAIQVNHDPLPEGASPATLILNGENAPAGYSYEPTDPASQGALEDLLGESSPEELPQVEPAQCAGVILDGTTFLDWFAQPAETTAVASFTKVDNEDDAVHVMVNTGPADTNQYTKDLAECAKTTKTRKSEQITTVKEFEVKPADLDVQGADRLVAAQTTLLSSVVNGEEAGQSGESLYVYTGSVRDAHFTIASTTAMPAEELATLATAQAKKISEA